MRSSNTGQAANPLPTVIGNISPRQLDTLDPIQAPPKPAQFAQDGWPESAARVIEEMSARDRDRAAGLEDRGEVAFLDVDNIPPHPTLADLVRGTPDTNTLAQMVMEIEDDPFRCAVRIWNLETFTRQLHDRVARLENANRKLR